MPYRRRCSNSTLLIIAVTVGIAYFMVNHVLEDGVKSDKGSTTSKLVRWIKKNLPSKKAIKCRGKEQMIIKNIYSRDPEGWYENRDICDTCFDFPNATLRTSYGPTPIFIYQGDQDDLVSGSVLDKGTFESEKEMILSEMMKDDPDLQIIDIGANIGVYTLSCAKAGRKVLAVEALPRNLQHLCASVMEGGLQDNVYLIHNAISNNNSFVSLGMHKGNMGGTYVDVNANHIKQLKEGEAQGTYGQVYSITLDDLLELPVIKHFRKVFIKMDIEGFEDRAVERATQFFEKVNVVGILMEWVFHRNHPTAKKIIDFMTERKYKPHACKIGKVPLDVAENENWGLDVLWLPNGS